MVKSFFIIVFFILYLQNGKNNTIKTLKAPGGGFLFRVLLQFYILQHVWLKQRNPRDRRHYVIFAIFIFRLIGTYFMLVGLILFDFRLNIR